jgi:hypothetical protein
MAIYPKYKVEEKKGEQNILVQANLASCNMKFKIFQLVGQIILEFDEV